MSKYLKYSYLLLLPLYFVLDGNNRFWNEIPLTDSLSVFLSLFIAVIITFYLIGKKITPLKAGIITVWLAVHYLFFKAIRNSTMSVTHLSFFKYYKFYLPFLLSLMILGTWLVVKLKEKNSELLNRFLRIFFLLIVLVELVKTGIHVYSYSPPAMRVAQPVLKPLSPGQQYPNIYFFIFDEYLGSKTLKQDIGFDNSAFHQALRNRNYFVAEDPSSNYNTTTCSMLSVLNMGYIDSLTRDLIASTKGYSECFRQINSNYISSFLAANRFELYNNSFFQIKNKRASDWSFIPVKKELLLNGTLGKILTDDWLCNVPSNTAQRMLRSGWAKADDYNQRMISRSLQQIRQGGKRVFIYTHLFMPHAPYLRDSTGNLRPLHIVHKEWNSPPRMTRYIGYIKYCNNTILMLADEIKKNDPGAIVVFASDHGYRNAIMGDKTRSEFNNFLSVYLPDKNYDGFTDSVSLVNLFRLILTKQYNQQLPLLPHKTINVNPKLQ